MMDNNKIVSLQPSCFQTLANLEHVSIANNRIHALTPGIFQQAVLPALKSIQMSKNSISYLASGTFNSLNNLAFIDLSGNHLQHLNGHTFLNMTNLKLIDLSGNQISQTEKLSFVDLPKLEYLSLRSNFLRDTSNEIIGSAPNVHTVDLSRNRFELFGERFLANLKNLQHLNLSCNLLTGYDVKLSKSTLTHLFLQHNNLKALKAAQFDDFSKLVVLDVRSNSLHDIHYKSLAGAKNLREIFLGENNLTNVRKYTFSQQKYIRTLDLSRNQIFRIDLTAFGKNNLGSIDLRWNKLTSLPNDSLSNVKLSLSRLDVSHNHIGFLDPVFLSELKNLSTLIAHENRIQLFEEANFKGLQKLR